MKVRPNISKHFAGRSFNSPLKQTKQAYKKATDKFEGFNQATDTVTMRRGPHITSAMEGTSDETYLRFKGQQPVETKYTQSSDGSITAYSLRKKTASPAKSCWSDYERVPGTKKGAKGSCRKK